MSDVTLVVTSCGRPDLLERTLESFFALNEYPLAGTIIIEDGPANPPVFPVPDLTYLANGVRIGQVNSIDRAYSLVQTPYVLHWEDDWETYRGGFIEPSLEILERYSDILQVWIRAHDDTEGHPIVQLPQFNVPTISTDDEGWDGFKWAPGLRRMSDYRRIGGYSQFKHRNSFGSELAISNAYHALGYHAAILPDPAGYVRHTGDDRSLGGWWNGRPRYEPTNLTFVDGLHRWLLGGSFTEQASQQHWRDYTSTADDGVAALSATVPEPEGFAYLAQEIFADDYLGAMAAFRGEVRVQGATGPAGLFLRLNNRGVFLRLRGYVSQSDDGGGVSISAQDKIHGPSTVDAALADPDNKIVVVPEGPDWTNCQVEALIPADTDTLVFGVFLAGPGRIELRDPGLTAAPDGRRCRLVTAPAGS